MKVTITTDIPDELAVIWRGKAPAEPPQKPQDATPTTNPSVTQDAVYEAVWQTGKAVPVEELRVKFPELGRQNLAAYLAHLTRRGRLERTPDGYIASA